MEYVNYYTTGWDQCMSSMSTTNLLWVPEQGN